MCACHSDNHRYCYAYHFLVVQLFKIYKQIHNFISVYFYPLCNEYLLSYFLFICNPLKYLIECSFTSIIIIHIFFIEQYRSFSMLNIVYFFVFSISCYYRLQVFFLPFLTRHFQSTWTLCIVNKLLNLKFSSLTPNHYPPAPSTFRQRNCCLVETNAKTEVW